MRLFGFEISRTKAQTLRGVNDSYGWWDIWSGGRKETDFQNDIHVHHSAVMANWAVFSCITLIASDIGKLCLRLVERDNDSGVWSETTSPAFSPVLSKPNRFQTRQKFIEQWIVSKLSHGNAYMLKERDNRGIVTAMYVLDPHRVKVLVSESGDVFYQLMPDILSGVPEDTDMVAVPASEIIHDTMVCLFHPLVGVSPIYACGLAATQGLEIQQNSAKFFKNMSRPGGLLSSDQEISDTLAKEYGKRWQENYGGNNTGKIAVLGGGLKYQGMGVNAVDAQLVDQLKLTAEMVCSTFHVPAFKIGAGVIPAGQKVEDLNQIYYTDCLQALMESAEALLDEGLGLDSPKAGVQMGTEFDLDDLLKMDSATMTSVLGDQVKAGLLKLNEGRARLNYGPMTGGDAAYLQQQNFSVEALSKRDALPNPFVIDKPTTNPTPSADGPAPTADPAAGKSMSFEVSAHVRRAVERKHRETANA